MNLGEVKQSHEGTTSLHTMAHASRFQVDALERDAFEVLRMVRSIKNSLAPINRLPLEVLSSIHDYCDEDEADGVSIALTHVCHSWRESFISCPSLWTWFDFKNIGKTHTYIRRSQSFPIKIHITFEEGFREIFPLIIPHIPRLKSLTVNGFNFPGNIQEHFYRHMPLLEKLSISSYGGVDDEFSDGDLSSLRELYLYQATDIPWKNLPHLQVLHFGSYLTHEITQLLDFLESVPLLHTVSLYLAGSVSDSSNAPPERIVALRHLKSITVYSLRLQATLLQHLHIPLRVSLVSESNFEGDGSPLLDYFQERSSNFCILSDITSTNVLLDPGGNQASVRLSGPSGNLSLKIHRVGSPSWHTAQSRTFRFLDPFLSTTRRLAISGYARTFGEKTKQYSISQILSSTSHLRTLILIDSDDLDAFARALNPKKDLSDPVFCRDMQELIIHTPHWTPLQLNALIEMAKNRASRGVGLSSITFVDRSGKGEWAKVYKLREHVAHVKYLVADEPPAWDDVCAEERKWD